MFKEAYCNWLICYCPPLGLQSRPFIAPGDTRPASTMPGDDYSKQFKRELLNYSHLESNIKMLNGVNFLFILKWVPNLYASESLPVGHDIFKKSFLCPFQDIIRAGINWCFVSFSFERLPWLSLISFTHGIWTVSFSFNFSASRQPFPREKSLSK